MSNTTLKFCWRSRCCQSSLALVAMCVAARQCTCALHLWNSPPPSAGNTGFISPVSTSVAGKWSVPKPGWLPNLGTDARTCVQDTAPRHQQLEAASHWHRGQAYHKMLSTKLLVNGESGYFHAWRQKNITLNICWNKSGTFQSHHPKTGSFKSHSATNSLPRKTRYVSRHFRRSYLKANKVSKSEGTKKVEYAYNFWKCADAVYSKLSKLVRLVETTACQSWCFFETQRVISLFGLVFSSAFRSVLNSNWDQRSAKKWSRFLVWSQRLTERLAETKLRTDRSLNPKLINSPVDFACTRYRLIS